MHPFALLLNKLKTEYTKKNWSAYVVTGPTPVREIFVSLALVKKARLTPKDRHTDDFLRKSLRGSIDDILHKKERIELKCLFTGRPGQAVKNQFVLVEGGPGIGKTKLVCHLCNKWAEGKILQQYELVIYVPLRRFQKDDTKEICIQDIISLYLKGDKGKHISEELSYNGCRNTLLILDGWDELPRRLRDDRHFFQDLVSFQCEFQNASVLVTSRCTVSHRLYHLPDIKHIEVLGFDSDHIIEYIASHIPDKKDMFLSHIEKFPNIRALLYIPLTLTIICDIVKDLDMKCDRLPSTLTEIYEKYICKKFFYGIKKVKPEYSGISSLSKLPKECSVVFQSLSMLALKRFEEGSSVFKLKHLKEVGFKPILGSLESQTSAESSSELLAIDSKFDGYGLLSSFPFYVGAGHEVLYQFHHLTIQEFLAAYYIAKFDRNKSPDLIKQYRLERRFQVVWKFFAGITRLRDKFARKAIIKDTRKGNNQDVLLLLHCVYEVQEPDVCKDVASHLERNLILNNRTLHKSDCLCLAYVLTNSGGKWTLNMRGCHIGGNGLEFLYSQLFNDIQNKSLTRKCVLSFSKLEYVMIIFLLNISYS